MFLFRDFKLNQQSELRVALCKIYGVGYYKSLLILSKIGISYPFFLKNLNSYQFSLIIFLLKGFLLSHVSIIRRISLNIDNLINMNNYIGVRHKMCLPVHGQRTRTNANTQRSKRIKFYLPENSKKRSRNKKGNKKGNIKGISKGIKGIKGIKIKKVNKK